MRGFTFAKNLRRLSQRLAETVLCQHGQMPSVVHLEYKVVIKLCQHQLKSSHLKQSYLNSTSTDPQQEVMTFTKRVLITTKVSR